MVGEDCITSLAQIKQEVVEPEPKVEMETEITLKRAIDEVAGRVDCDEQLKRCKLKIEAANEEGPPESSNGARLLAAQPSTSQPVTVSCEAKDGDLLTDFGERRCSSRSKASNLRHVLVFKGMEMEYFIDLVRRNEVLWDGSVDEYHTRTNKKKQAWESIAEEMSNDLKHVDEETCRKIWLQLRRSYANEKRLQKLNPASRTTRNCKYRRYFDAMKFLDGVVDEEWTRRAGSFSERLINLDTVSDNFFISEPEGGKSCSNSPAPEHVTAKKDAGEPIRKSDDGHKEVSPVENDGAISASKVIDTLTLLAQQLQGQGSESVEIVQPASSVVQLAQATVQPVQPTVQQKSDQISAITEQQFYQQLETCFFMLAPDKQEVLRRDIMKYAFRRTNQLMDDNN